MYEKFFESSKEMLFPHENKDVQISKMLIGKQVWPSRQFENRDKF